MPPIDGAVWFAVVLSTTVVLTAVSLRHVRPRTMTAYAVLGMVAAVIVDQQGDWTWLALAHAMRSSIPAGLMALACLGAVLLGAVLTSLVGGRFRFIPPNPSRMLREALGGALMAAGAILIPGGNDTLLVAGVPAGDPRALGAYAVMFALMFSLLRASPVLRGWAAWRQPTGPDAPSV